MTKMSALSLFDELQTKTKVILSVAAVGLILYLVGVKFLLFPALTVLAFLYLPLPGIFRSVFSRAFVSLFLTFSLLPIAGALQFLCLSWLPSSDFKHTAILFTVLHAALLLYVPARKAAKERLIFTAADACGLLVGVLFILPFISIVLGDDTFARILQFAGFQVVDAGHHFSFLNHYGQVQFLNLGYYPAGFHFSVAFLQEGAVGQLFDAGWRVNAALYFGHYMFLGMALAYAAYYLCLSIFEALKSKVKLLPKSQAILLAACLGPALAIFYILPLFAHGFLNYFYVITALLLGFIFLVDIRKTTDITVRRWGVLAYLLLAYSAVSSWSLFIPLVLLVGAFFFLPQRFNVRAVWREVTAFRSLPIIALFALQFILIYFQATTVQLGSREGFNATGNLYQLHYLVLLAGLVVVVTIALSKKIDESVKKLAYGIFLPAFLFVACMTLVQYFQVGEVRYFSVKIGLFVEILSLVLAVALLVHAYVESDGVDYRSLILLPFVPIIAMTMLMSTMDSPLREIREIFKPHSGIDKPQYYDKDARIFVELGSKDKMKHFNAISLHYIKEIPKLDGYMQLSYRANLFRQGDDSTAISSVYGKKTNMPKPLTLRECNDKVYAIIEYGSATKKEQEAVVRTLRKCAGIAKAMGLDYYIVTDKISAPYIESVFGDVAKVVY